MWLWLSVWLYFEAVGVLLLVSVCLWLSVWLYFEVVGVWLRVSVVVL